MSTLNLSKSKISNKYSAKLEGDAVLVESVPTYIDKHSIDFDGANDYIEFNSLNANTSIGTGDCTFSFWLKFGIVDANHQTFCYCGDPTANEDYFQFRYDPTGSIFTVNARLGASGGSSVSSTTIVSAGTWYHLVFTRTGTTGELYINGVSENSIIETSFSTPLDSLFKLGAHRASIFFSGKISQVGIWNKVLTASEVNAIFNNNQGIDLAVNSGNYASSSNLVGYWRLNEGSGTNTADSSGNGHNGTLTNGPTWKYDVPSLTPTKNYSVDFDGTNDYVASDFDASSFSSISVGVWIKASTFQTVNSMVSQWENNNFPNSSFAMYSIADGVNDDAVFIVGIGSNYYEARFELLSIANWYHIVGTYDGSVVRIYVNGVIGSTTASTTGNLNNSTEQLRFGSISGVHQWSGKISNVSVWNSALSASEIVALYNSGKGLDASSDSGNYTSSSDLVGYWKLNDGGGTTAIDSSSNSNDGTLTNGPTWSEDVPHNNPVDNNYSVDFDGANDYIDCGDIAEIDNASKITVNCWIKMDETSSNQSAFSKYVSSLNRLNLGFYANEIYFNTSNGSGSYGVCSFTSIDWAMVTLVFDGTATGNANRLKGYINGVEQTLTFTGTIPATLGNLTGNNVYISRQDTAYLDGKSSVVCVWASALTQNEVTEIYNNGKSINLLENLGDYASSANVVGYWRLEEGAGIYTKDISGNNNHGTLTNGPTWSSDAP